MRFSTFPWWSLGLVALLLGGCVPIYQTEYSFVPPRDSEGKRCLNQCLGMQTACRANEENRVARENNTCQQNAMLTYTTCLAAAKNDEERGRCSSSSYCQKRPDFSRCEADYRQCYRNCGGIVNARQVCVFGCN